MNSFFKKKSKYDFLGKGGVGRGGARFSNFFLQRIHI